MTNDEFGVFAKQVADIGSAFYFHPDTLATGKASGLDGFRFYFVGRGGVLGDVEADVVHSAFGYFEPALFATMWNSAKEIIPARDGARLYMGCNHALGRAKLADVAGLDAFCEAAGAVNDAIDPTGLALYAGVAAEPVPDDLPARAIHLAMVLREARGSTHLLALVASGLAPRLAHQIRRPDDVSLFGWPEPVAYTDADSTRWAAAEALTNELLSPSFAVLDPASERALLAGAKAIHTALTT
ncbi:MAG: hypothetical protein M3431_10510 [Actinomycetota bacterium]|nr:hypothetical protein [Actinomycetota bacterium]